MSDDLNVGERKRPVLICLIGSGSAPGSAPGPSVLLKVLSWRWSTHTRPLSWPISQAHLSSPSTAFAPNADSSQSGPSQKQPNTHTHTHRQRQLLGHSYTQFSFWIAKKICRFRLILVWTGRKINTQINRIFNVCPFHQVVDMKE